MGCREGYQSSPGQRGSQDEGSVLLQRGLGAVQPMDHQLESAHGEEVLSIVHLMGREQAPMSRRPTQQPLESALLQEAEQLFPPGLTRAGFEKAIAKRERLWLECHTAVPGHRGVMVAGAQPTDRWLLPHTEHSRALISYQNHA